MPGQVRYRRCPNCELVQRASAFRHATGLTFAPGAQQRRRCPACGHVGPLLGFQIVERPDPNRGEAP